MSYINAYNDPRHVDPRNRGETSGRHDLESDRFAAYGSSSANVSYPYARGRGRGGGSYNSGRGRGRGRGGKSFAQRSGNPVIPKRPTYEGGGTPKNSFTFGRNASGPGSSNTPVNAAPTQTPSLVSGGSDSQSQSGPPSSPAVPEPLDSLDKLIRFSMSVGVGDPDKEGAMEVSNLASIAESFLNKRMETVAPSSSPSLLSSKVASRTEAGPQNTLSSPVSVSPRTRAGELKDLLKSKKRKGDTTPTYQISSPNAVDGSDKNVVHRAESPQKRRRGSTKDLLPPNQVAMGHKRPSSPRRIQAGPNDTKPLPKPHRASISRSNDYRRSAQNFVPDRFQCRSSSPATERSLAYSHRSSRSPMRYESYGGSRHDERPRSGPLLYAKSAVLSEGRKSEATMVGARGSTASLLRGMTLGSEVTVRPPLPDRQQHRQKSTDHPRVATERIGANVWQGQYGKDNFPTGPGPRPPLPGGISPLNMNDNGTDLTIGPTVAQDVLQTLAALKAQIAKLEAQLPLAGISPLSSHIPLVSKDQPVQAAISQQPRVTSEMPVLAQEETSGRTDYRNGARRSTSPPRAALGNGRYDPPYGSLEQRRDRRQWEDTSPRCISPRSRYRERAGIDKSDKGAPVHYNHRSDHIRPESPLFYPRPDLPERKVFTEREDGDWLPPQIDSPWKERARSERSDRPPIVPRERGRGKGRGRGGRGRGRGC